jgi:hypothetical protein
MKGFVDMKKSEMYKVAMMAVVSSIAIAPDVKVEIVKELIESEKLELYREGKEEEEAEKERINRSLANTVA